LQGAGIDSVVLERRSRDYVLGRVRAGVIEQGTVEILRKAGVAARLEREGLLHHGVEIATGERRHRIDFAAQRASVTVYGQTELTKDLVDARDSSGVPPLFDVEDVVLEDVVSARPRLRYRQGGEARVLECDFIAGCDGFHGVSRKAIPAAVLKTHERVYPFGWLGVLADAPPVSSELIYLSHERGFALCSMRSATRSRCYLQCDLDTNVADWSDERFWEELASRLPAELAARVTRAPTIEKSVAPLRSFVAEPLRYGRLLLAGDAAHIVPPTGAKGLNLAASDVLVLARALKCYYESGRKGGLDTYSAVCLRRVWKAQRFSWWMTSLLHNFPDESPFDRQRRLADLDYLTSSQAAMTSLAEQYVGLPQEVGV